jgi:hypothetical protein
VLFGFNINVKNIFKYFFRLMLRRSNVLSNYPHVAEVSWLTNKGSNII